MNAKWLPSSAAEQILATSKINTRLKPVAGERIDDIKNKKSSSKE